MYLKTFSGELSIEYKKKLTKFCGTLTLPIAQQPCVRYSWTLIFELFIGEHIFELLFIGEHKLTLNTQSTP